MDFKTLAYAKLNLNFDRDLFIREYDEHILPRAIPIANGIESVLNTYNLNKIWGMVPEEVYNTSDVHTQLGDTDTWEYIKRSRPAWMMTQLMELDTTNITEPILLKNARVGGNAIKNSTLEPKYKWSIKDEFKDLEIYKWIVNNLPFEKLHSIHCVSIEPGGFATIHRDQRGFWDNQSSAGVNRVYENGYVVISLNVSSGGSPLCWALDDKNMTECRQANDDVFLINDYFFHGVPVVSSRRRAVRVTVIPKPEMWDLFDRSTIIDLGKGYNFNPTFPNL